MIKNFVPVLKMDRFPLLRLQHKKIFHLQNMNFSLPPKHTLSTNIANKIRDRSLKSSVQLSETEDESNDIVKFSFVTHEGEEIEVEAECGESIVAVGLKSDVFPDSTCNGAIECAMCHVYVEEEIANLLSEKSENEEDTLDNEKYSKPNSRLSCQLFAAKRIEGARFHLPKPTTREHEDEHST